MGSQDTLGNAFSDLRRKEITFEEFIETVQRWYAGIPYSITDKNQNEQLYQSLIYAALMGFGADVQAEDQTADGRMDIALKLPDAIYIIELKYGKSAEEATDQIIAKDYALKDLLKWVAKCASEVEDSDKKQNKYKKSIVINDRSPSERRYLECEMSFIHFGFRNHVTGYLVEITDDTEQHNMIESMSFRGESLKREVERQTKRAKSMQMSTILGMAAMIESRDRRSHQQNIRMRCVVRRAPP